MIYCEIGDTEYMMTGIWNTLHHKQLDFSVPPRQPASHTHTDQRQTNTDTDEHHHESSKAVGYHCNEL